MPRSRLTATELNFFRLQTSILVKFMSDQAFWAKGGAKANYQPSVHQNLYVVLAGGGCLSFQAPPPPTISNCP